jgi:hypothetical protein
LPQVVSATDEAGVDAASAGLMVNEVESEAQAPAAISEFCFKKVRRVGIDPL